MILGVPRLALVHKFFKGNPSYLSHSDFATVHWFKDNFNLSEVLTYIPSTA